MCLQVLTAYLTLRRLGSENAATAGAFLMVLFYGLATHTHYLHYSTEMLPTLLLMVGIYSSWYGWTNLQVAVLPHAMSAVFRWAGAGRRAVV